MEQGFYRSGGEYMDEEIASADERFGVLSDDYTAKVWGVRVYLRTPDAPCVGIGITDEIGEVIAKDEWRNAMPDVTLAKALEVYFGPLREHLIQSARRSDQYQAWIADNDMDP